MCVLETKKALHMSSYTSPSDHMRQSTQASLRSALLAPLEVPLPHLIMGTFLVEPQSWALRGKTQKVQTVPISYEAWDTGTVQSPGGPKPDTWAGSTHL